MSFFADHLPPPSSPLSSNILSPDISPSTSLNSDEILSSSPNATLPKYNLELGEISPSSIFDSRDVSVQSSLSNHDDELADNVSSSFSASEEFNSNSTWKVNSEVSTPTLSESDDTHTNEHLNASLEECEVLSEPLYTGSNVTVGTTICAIMEFCLHNGLTYKATDALLKLLQLFCASPNKLPRSIFVLKKFFNQFTSMNYKQCRICSNCKELSESCHCDKASVGDLLEIPIDKPLKVIVSRKLLL